MIHLEVRKKIVEAKKNGVKVKDICAANSVGKTAVYNLLKQERESGAIEPKTYLRGRKSSLSADELAAIENEIKIKRDITAAEIKENLNLTLCESSVCKIIRNKLGYRYKKRQYTPVNESDRT